MTKSDFFRFAQGIVCSVFLYAGCSSDSTSQSPVDPTLVWIDTVEAYPGSSAVVNVNADLKSTLQGLQMPLQFGSNDVIIDSVSFVGTLLSTNPFIDTVPISVDSAYVDILRSYTASYVIPPSVGKLASLHVTIAADAEFGTVSVDTFTRTLPNANVHRLLLSDNTANEIEVEFTEGAVIISPTP
jgi:hypothetical protein